jgi:hypothetical protein
MATITLDEVKTTTIVSKTEMYDPDVMDALLTDKSFSHKVLRALGEYRKNRKGGNKVPVIYTLGKGHEESKLGRLFPQNSAGLGVFPRDIRNPLLERFYFDVDIENAHYNLMLKIAADNGWEHKAMKQYVENREAELLKVSKDRRIAKTSFLKAAFGGNTKLWNEHVEDCGLPDGDITLLKSIESEVKRISENLYNSKPEFHKYFKKKNSPQFSLLALILQTEERKCLMVMDKFLSSKARSLDILIHDGGCVRKLPEEETFPQELLTGMEESIKQVLDYKVRIIVKPFEHDFVVPEQNLLDPRILISDKYAAQKFIEICGDDILYSQGSIHIYDPNTGIWSHDEHILRSKILQTKNKLVFKQLNALGGVMVHDYSGSVKNIDKLVKILPSAMSEYPLRCNNEFFENGKEASFKKILFLNGIYDFETNTLFPFNRNIVFTANVPLIFTPERVKEDTDYIFNTLFRAPFKNTTNADIFLHYLMRGFIGDYRNKKFLAMIGMADTGKGVLTTAFQKWFGKVVAQFPANSLLLRQNTDPLRDLGFLLEYADCRLLFSSEVKPGQNLSTELMKSIVSGGDTLIGRKLYKNEEQFINRAKLCMMCNDFPGIAPADPQISDRIIPINYDFSFKTEVRDMSYEKLADPLIKNTLTHGDSAQKYGMAMVHIFIECYTNWIKDGGKEPKLSVEIMETKEDIVPKDELSDALHDKYIFTKNENDLVKFQDVFEFITETKKLTYSKNYLARVLTQMKSGVKNTREGMKVLRCRTGMRISPEWRESKDEYE